jgi:hypothetical protein
MNYLIADVLWRVSWRMRSHRIVKGTGSPPRALRVRVKVLRDEAL